jgi:hypothetical protein
VIVAMSKSFACRGNGGVAVPLRHHDQECRLETCRPEVPADVYSASAVNVLA